MLCCTFGSKGNLIGFQSMHEIHLGAFMNSWISSVENLIQDAVLGPPYIIWLDLRHSNSRTYFEKH